MESFKGDLHFDGILFEHLFEFVLITYEDTNAVYLHDSFPVRDVRIPGHLQWAYDTSKISGMNVSY